MISREQLPPDAGSYVLHLYVSSMQVICVGRLGEVVFPAGHYFYCGSALGAGGLRARVGRHLGGEGQPHWHVDALRAIADVRDVFYTLTDQPLECQWSQSLAVAPQAVIPVLHFGSSDCRLGCAAHLVAFFSRIRLASIRAVLKTPLVHLH